MTGNNYEDFALFICTGECGSTLIGALDTRHSEFNNGDDEVCRRCGGYAMEMDGTVTLNVEYLNAARNRWEEAGESHE